MMEIDLDKIRQVRLHWDWTLAILPREAIYRLAYEPVKEAKENESVILEMDLAYIQSHHCAWMDEGKPETDTSILEALKECNIEELEWQGTEEIRRSFLDLPSNRRSVYTTEKKWANEWEAPNLCEHHTIQGNRYILEWKKAEREEVDAKLEEWKIFFKSGNLCQIGWNQDALGTVLFDRILEENRKENAVWKRIEKLSGGEVTFPDYAEMLTKTRRKIHEINHATRELLGLKRGYLVTQITEQVHEMDIAILNAKNHAHHWNLNWICASNLENEKESQRLEQVLLAGEANEDTANYFSRTILVVEEKSKIEEWLLKYYRKIYGRKTKITGEKLLVITTEDLNQYWYEIRQKWRLL